MGAILRGCNPTVTPVDIIQMSEQSTVLPFTLNSKP